MFLGALVVWERLSFSHLSSSSSRSPVVMVSLRSKQGRHKENPNMLLLGIMEWWLDGTSSSLALTRPEYRGLKSWSLVPSLTLLSSRPSSPATTSTVGLLRGEQPFLDAIIPLPLSQSIALAVEVVVWEKRRRRSQQQTAGKQTPKMASGLIGQRWRHL